MVMLQVEGRDRWLAFYIPLNEANRLARCLGMTSCPCTPIFELTEQLIGHLRAEVRRAHPKGTSAASRPASCSSATGSR